MAETRTVRQGNTWAGQCAAPCGWSSTGWPTRKLAAARLADHEAEHKTGKPARELTDFRGKYVNGPAG